MLDCTMDFRPAVAHCLPETPFDLPRQRPAATCARPAASMPEQRGESFGLMSSLARFAFQWRAQSSSTLPSFPRRSMGLAFPALRPVPLVGAHLAAPVRHRQAADTKDDAAISECGCLASRLRGSPGPLASTRNRARGRPTPVDQMQSLKLGSKIASSLINSDSNVAGPNSGVSPEL